MRSTGPLAPVVEGRALFLQTVGLDVGRVEVDGRATGGQLLPASLGQQLEPPASELAHRCLDVTEDRLVEVLGPSDKGRGRRDGRHGPQRGAGRVLAGEVEIDHEVSARAHGLGQRDDELTDREPPPEGRLLAHAAVEGGPHRKDAVELGHQVQARPRGEGGVRVTKRHNGAVAAYRVHLTGAFLFGAMGL